MLVGEGSLSWDREQVAGVFETSAEIILALRLLWSISAPLFAGNGVTARLSGGEEKP